MITRFAPSPTGPLHLGHAYSAALAHDLAGAAGGTFYLRIEDIDRARSRDRWEKQIFDDLGWLGLRWHPSVTRQSDRLPAYRSALQSLYARGLLYPCDCNRRDILEAASAPHEGEPAMGPDGIVYPGTCRTKPRAATIPDGVAIRLDMRKALQSVGEAIEFEETGSGPKAQTGRIEIDDEWLVHSVGDVVLARRDMGTSYHLSVVIDDAAQEITDVVRGEDLFDATSIHVVLQRLLGLPTPRYHHHRLIRDDTGRRLAKREDAKAIAVYREAGATPEDVRRLIGL